MPLKKVFLFFVTTFLFVECVKIEHPAIEPIFSTGLYEAPIVTSNDVLERAYQMANMKWTPLNPIPKRGGGYYMPGKTIKGAPYSSVKEINTFLFQDVSYQTFMTAVHNPYSVIYTENISEMPYHGANCATYYGSICSSAVMWVLGISIPYSTGQIVVQPFMKRMEHQVIDSLKVCDVLWKNGHVQMVYDLEKKSDGSVIKISLFEQSGNSAHISSYMRTDFERFWSEGRYEAYRYRFMNYSENRLSFSGFPLLDFNNALCPSKGDQATYRTDEVITINLLDLDYPEIVLTKGGKVVSVDLCEGKNHCYSNLSSGIYSVYLQSPEKKSESISFEVIDLDVRVSVNKSKTVVYFDSSIGKADYVAFCQQNGVPLLYFPISEEDRIRNYVVVPSLDYSDYYCKVVFQCDYGTIINRPIKVR